jgi:hypothetical protein
VITEAQHGLKYALGALYEVGDRMKGGVLYETPLESEPLKNQNQLTEENPDTISMFQMEEMHQYPTLESAPALYESNLHQGEDSSSESLAQGDDKACMAFLQQYYVAFVADELCVHSKAAQTHKAPAELQGGTRQGEQFYLLNHLG